MLDLYLSPLMPTGIGLAWVSIYHIIITISKPGLHLKMNRLNLSYRMSVFNLFQSEIKAKKPIEITEKEGSQVFFLGKICNTFKLEVI